MISCKEFLDHVGEVCGEPVLPHFYLYNAQINVGKVGAEGPVDQVTGLSTSSTTKYSIVKYSQVVFICIKVAFRQCWLRRGCFVKRY